MIGFIKKIISLVIFGSFLFPCVTHAALTDQIVAFWNLNETSGNRLDSIGSNTLTAVAPSGSIVSSTVGKINQAANLLGSRYLTKTDNTDLSTGDIDYTISAWVYLTSKSSAVGIVSKFSGSTNREHLLWYDSSSDRFIFQVSGNGSTSIAVTASNVGSPSINTWYHIVAWHDSSANTINIQVNNGTANSAAHSTGSFNSTADFQIGAYNSSNIFKGKIDAVGFWKRVLTTQERSDLYNSGEGIEYSFDASDTTPGQISSMMVLPENDSARLTWDAPTDGGSPITDYIIEYKLSSAGSWSTFNDGVSISTTGVVTGLTDGQEYNFRVSAVNIIGTGTPSATRTINLIESTLDDDLVAFYNFNETSGTRADSVDGYDMPEVGGTISSASGVRDSAVSFSSSQYLSTSDNMAYSIGDNDFTISTWVYLTAKNGLKGIVGKYDGTVAANREYVLYYSNSDDRFYLTAYNNSGSAVNVAATNFGSPSINTWYHIVAWHDSSANTINIQVNNGTANSSSLSGGIPDLESNFQIGAYNSSNALGGRMDSLGIWRRILTTDEKTSLYNSSLGIEYPFTSDSQLPDSITVLSPADYQVFQRDVSNYGTITVSGTYTGNPSTIEASWNGEPYEVIDNAPSGGSFSGQLINKDIGQGSVTVRFSNNTSINQTITPVGIGDIYVIAGQSNASGRGTNNQSYSHATLTASLFGNDDVWKNLVDPTDSATSQVDSVSSDITSSMGSAWPLLATYILADQSVPVAFIPTAKGGSTSTQWLPGVSHSDASTLYGSMYRRIQATGGAKAVLFFQGENDVAASVSEGTYLSNLHTITDAIFDDFGIQTVVGLIGNLSGESANDIDNIRRAQVSAWDNAVDNVLPGPVTADQNLSDESGDGVHFKTNTELAIFAQRWWASLKDLFYGGTNGRGPRLSSAEYNNTRDEILLTFISDSTPILFSETISANVFSVTNDGSAVTINSATIQNGNEILLDITSTVSGTLKVSLASGNNGGLGTYPTDSSIYELPAEPFSEIVATASISDVVAPTIDLVPYTPDPVNDATPTITGTVVDTAGTIASVEFQVDGTSGMWTLCTADDGVFDESSEMFSCTTEALSDNTHTVYIRATDNAANTTTGGDIASDIFTVDTTAPTISTLSPADNTGDVSISTNLVLVFSSPVDIGTGNIVIKKTDGDTIVETIDVAGGQVTGGGTDTITINPLVVLDGQTSYYVQIDATAFDDNAGNGYVGISDTVSWNFTTTDVAAPTITSISSDKADGTYDTGEVIDIDVTFSENVTSTGNVTITLETGATDRTCTFTILNSDTGTCNYTVQIGDTSSDLDATISGTIEDQSGNALSDFTPGTTLAANKALVIDGTAPDTDGPIISSIVADPDETSVVITWTTDEVSSSQIAYGLTSSYGTTTTESDTSPRVTSHSVTITGLTDNTTYHFKVISVDESANSADSGDMTFTTLDSAVPPSDPDPVIPTYSRVVGYSRSLSLKGPTIPVQRTPLVYSRLLKFKTNGPDVLELQKQLNKKGFVIANTGAGSAGNETTYFGLLTRAAVMRFQLANGLIVDGIVGPKTIEMLNR